MKVICISGSAQHGKDTSAEMMRKILWGFGKKVLIVHNADLLKFMCKLFFNWDGVKDDRGRTLLQHVGTDVIRRQRPNFWVGFIADALTMFDGQWDYVIIPDCRFPNEISVLRACGFDPIHVRVIRENFDNGLTEEQNDHPSETALNGTKADATILNNGTLTDLTGEVMRFIMPVYAMEEYGDDWEHHLYDLA